MNVGGRDRGWRTLAVRPPMSPSVGTFLIRVPLRSAGPARGSEAHPSRSLYLARAQDGGSSMSVEHPGNYEVRAPKKSQCVPAHYPLNHRNDIVELVGRIATVSMGEVVARDPKRFRY